jgi:hypothetical protein
MATKIALEIFNKRWTRGREEELPLSVGVVDMSNHRQIRCADGFGQSCGWYLVVARVCSQTARGR